MNKLKRIAVTYGEPAGIGPEICLDLAHFEGRARPIILGDKTWLQHLAHLLKKNILFRDYHPHDADNFPKKNGVLEVLHLPLAVPVRLGQPDVKNAPHVLSLLDRAILGCQSGEFSGIVTAPVHKEIINAAGILFSGHTEYLAEKTGTPQVVMMLAGEQGNGQGMLRVALATTHLPLKNVPDAISEKSLTRVLKILIHDLHSKYGIQKPRILVAGLNPHAGEGGYLGREEIDIISPVIQKLAAEGFSIEGPFPADTLFTPPFLGRADAVLAMYHDQGLAPLKYATFGRGINITLGLPLIRTSVDHGTALSIAGIGKARHESLFAALEEAARMGEA